MKVKRIKDMYFFHPKSKIKAGEGLDKGDYPFFTSSGIQSKWLNDFEFNNRALILGTGGKASLHFAEGRYSVSTDCFVLSSKQEEVNIKFTYYYLNYNFHLIERGFKGAGLEHISKEYVENIEISYPDLETQNKIVVILDKAKSILDKREDSIQKYNELLRATFVDMFGDPVLNTMEWSKDKIKTISERIVDCPHSTPPYLDSTNEYPCIRTSELKNGEIYWDSMKYISYETYIDRILRLKPEENDVIFGREGTVGDAILVPENINISLGQRVVLFRVNTEFVNPVFFWAQILSDGIQFEIKKRIIGATVKRINIADLTKIELIIPPLKLQEKFTQKANRIIKLTKKLKHSSEFIEDLYNSLSQLAFKGELEFGKGIDLEILLDNDYTFFKKHSNKKSIQQLLGRIDKNELNENMFYAPEIYDKAKSFIFELLKDGKIEQEFDYKESTVKLKLK